MDQLVLLPLVVLKFLLVVVSAARWALISHIDANVVEAPEAELIAAFTRIQNPVSFIKFLQAYRTQSISEFSIPVFYRGRRTTPQFLD